jgi:hypothetical protein
MSSGQGTLQLSATCHDLAGNQGTATDAVKVDLTAPTVSVTGVADKAAYTLGSLPTAGCSTIDTLSGVAASASLQLTGGTANGVGTFTATCSGAQDKAGNAAPAVSASYTVNYAFSGFLAPVDGPPTVNAGKAGKTYPVKFQLTSAGGYVSSLSAVTSITSKATSCSAFSSDPTDALETDTTGSTGLRYDSTANQYIYNWATPSKAGCYTLYLNLDSGQVLPAYFSLS